MNYGANHTSQLRYFSSSRWEIRNGAVDWNLGVGRSIDAAQCSKAFSDMVNFCIGKLCTCIPISI